MNENSTERTKTTVSISAYDDGVYNIVFHEEKEMIAVGRDTAQRVANHLGLELPEVPEPTAPEQWG